MRDYKTPDGERRLWFDPTEIETMIEDELRRAQLMPTRGAPVVDVERFVESHLRVRLDQHAALPDDVLGVTYFERRSPPRIAINRDLTGSALDEDDSSPGLLGRWRATVAHEACHVILHRMLFDEDLNQGALFTMEPEASSEQLLRCLKRDVGHGRRPADWREVQANAGMGALLMPQRAFKTVVRSELAALGLSSVDLKPGSTGGGALVRRLAERFEVSRQAARIRLATLGFIESDVPQLLAPES